MRFAPDFLFCYRSPPTVDAIEVGKVGFRSGGWVHRASTKTAGERVLSFLCGPSASRISHFSHFDSPSFDYSGTEVPHERQSRFRGRDTPKPRHIFDILNDGRFKKAH